MSSIVSDLEQFHRFIGERLASGKDRLTPEECLEVWRADHPSPDELVDSIAAVEVGLEQARRGEGIPLDDFVRHFRVEKGILDGS